MPSTIEQRLESVEQTLAEVRQKVDSLENGTRQLKWWERIGRARSSEELVEFDESVACGRYFRKTGSLPPTHWRAGDPIPEGEFDQ